MDEACEAYLKGRSQRPWTKYEAGPDAEYERTVVIDLDALEPTVSYPHLPENTHLAKEGADIKIDQVVIGSCTNGRIEDMEAAYNVLKGKHIAKGVRGIIIPATMAVYKECILRGYTEAFIDAGCIVSTPTCGPCLAATWVFWPSTSAAFPPPTATLSAAWGTLPLKFIWQAPPPPPPAH